MTSLATEPALGSGAPDPGFALRLTQAFVLQRQGEEGRARALYEQILATDPHEASAATLLAELHYENGRGDEAVEVLRNAMDGAPEEAALHQALGRIHLAMGRPADALRAYEAADRLTPDDPDVLVGLGRALSAGREFARAERAFRRVLGRDPGRVDALRRLETMLRHLGRTDEAAELLRAYERLEPDRPFTGFMLAACGERGAPPQAPADFVESVFDHYAHKFDQSLGDLQYRGPQLIRALLDDLTRGPRAELDALDLGCGTGLCAPALVPFARRLVGVDLSEKMLGKARERGLYDQLVKSDLTDYLTREPGAFDLVLAADVLVYFGRLEDVFRAVASALRPDGLFVFTLERLQGEADPEGHRLEPCSRYAHAPEYVVGALGEAGLRPVRMDTEQLRLEWGEPVPALIVGARGARALSRPDRPRQYHREGAGH